MGLGSEDAMEGADELATPVTIPVEAYISEEYARAERDKLWRALAESECEHPKAGNGDCEKETVGNEFITCPHDRTPVRFDH